MGDFWNLFLNIFFLSFSFLFFSSGRRSKILLINLRNFCFRYTLDGEIYLFLIENICAAPRILIFLFERMTKILYIYGDRIISKTIKYSLRTHILCARTETTHARRGKRVLQIAIVFANWSIIFQSNSRQLDRFARFASTR